MYRCLLGQDELKEVYGMSDYVPETKDFTNAPLCLSGHGVTKVFGLGEKKTVAVDHVDFDFTRRVRLHRR